MTQKQIIGMMAIIGGILLFVLSLGTFILRLILAIIGLILISYGLRLHNQPPLFVWIQHQYFRMRR